MRARSIVTGCLLLASACAADDLAVGVEEQAVISTKAQQALDWANDWIDDAIATPGQVSENVYTTVNPGLVAMSPGVSAKNRTVCGTFLTRLVQASTSYTSSNFFNSFNKAMTSCEYGTVDGVQKGTNSPDAAQYHHKIASCANTGVIRYTVRNAIIEIEAGDVIAVKYTDPANHNNATGHVMLVRSAPVADANLAAGPTGSTGYRVEVIDSTQSTHGSGDWRALDAGQGLGTGTFVLYADANDHIVASRWSPSDPTLNDTTAHPIAVGSMQ